MGKHIPIPMGLGGMYSAGDAGTIPDGTVYSLLNILPRPNRFPSRPPAKYDSLMSISGLTNFDDQTNKVNRLLALETSRLLYMKGTSGETRSASLGAASATSGSRLTGATNYRGKIYGMMDDGTGLPSAAFSFDGTNLSTSPFTSAIAGRNVDVFNDRLHIDYPRVVVTPQPFGATLNNALYDITTWTQSGCTARNMVSNGQTTCRVYVTSTTAGRINQPGVPGYSGVFSFASTATVRTCTWASYMKGVDSSYRAPFKMQLFISNDWAGPVAYAVDNIINDGTNLQRCTTAGTSGGVAPTWATTVGATTADGAGTLVWTCEGSRYIGTLETVVPNSTEALQPTAFVLTAIVPPSSWTLYVRPVLWWFNTLNPTVTLSAVDVSFRDALADGDTRKKNWGQQFTYGDFSYPFVNVESASTSTQDLAETVWSELGDPTTFKRANTYQLQESAGYPTASCVIGGRRVVFKRNAHWVFIGTDDPYIPIRRERPINTNIGCLGPLAHDEYENETFFIGESDLYRMKAGDDEPTPFCGDGMREEIMNKGSNWVESQSTYKRPLLKIDKSKLIAWVYTQKGKLYAYDLRNQMWSAHQISTGIEVDAMLWNQNTGNFYIALGGYGLVRMDYSTGSTTGANDTIDNTATTYSGTMSVVLRPVEIYNPPHFDATLEEIILRDAIAISGQTVTVYYSLDQGKTWPYSQALTVSSITAGDFEPMRFDCWESGPSVTVKVECTGKLGEVAFALSKRIYARLNVRRGEYVQQNQTAGAATL